MRKKIILSREKNAYHEPERTTYELRIRQTVLTLSSFASFFFLQMRSVSRYLKNIYNVR